jgi:hypothetical protein
MPRHMEITEHRQQKQANINIFPILLGRIKATNVTGEN